jgi:hypothetical protein
MPRLVFHLPLDGTARRVRMSAEDPRLSVR